MPVMGRGIEKREPLLKEIAIADDIDTLHLRHLPFNKDDRLQRRKRLMQTEDSSYVYLLYVDSFLPKGSVMPYELAEDEIRESMRNEQKVAFIRSVKEDLYNSALERGRVKYPDRHE